MKFPNFTQALNNLGRNDQERAERLGIPVRTLTRYKAGKLPRSLLIWVNNPTALQILHALASDAQNLQAYEQAYEEPSDETATEPD
jgi:hypothetical protein